LENHTPKCNKNNPRGLATTLFRYQLAESKAKGMVLMKLPNGYGSVVKLSGKRRNPYQVRKTTG
jgi:hypothetical protein